jgi:hypothetical protein
VPGVKPLHRTQSKNGLSQRPRKIRVGEHPSSPRFLAFPHRIAFTITASQPLFGVPDGSADGFAAETEKATDLRVVHPLPLQFENLRSEG